MHKSELEADALSNVATPVTSWNTKFISSLHPNSNVSFVIMYDFVTGLAEEITSIQLSVALYVVSKGTEHYGQPVFLDQIYTTMAIGDQGQSKTAFIGAKQPVSHSSPDCSFCLIIELLTSRTFGPLITSAWCLVELFDFNGQFLSGPWRIPFQELPIQPAADLSIMRKYGNGEVFLRLALSSATSILPNTALPSATAYLPAYKQNVKMMPKQQPKEFGSNVNSGKLTFQLDRIKGADPFNCKLRLTAYHKRTGQAVKAGSGPVTCITATVDSRHRYRCHVFGQQRESFDSLRLQGDEVIIVRVYMVLSYNSQRTEIQSKVTDPRSSFVLAEFDREDDDMNGEILVAWGSLSLVASSKKYEQHCQDIILNAGIHVIPLFCPPVPDIKFIGINGASVRERYQRASLRLNIISGILEPGSLTSSEDSDETDDPVYPEEAWLLGELLAPPSKPFTASDGFYLYIDGCRYLPENVSVTRVSASILDKQYTKVGRAMSCTAKLDSDIHAPVFGFRAEFLEPAFPPTATLIIKIYTLDDVSQLPVIIGFALLNIFVEIGTSKQPIADVGMQVSLNEGAHQLRIYSQGPEGDEPLSVSCIANCRHIPCATILVRLVKAIVGPQGKPLEMNKVPEADWVKMGLFQPIPNYASQVYYSEGCCPDKGEWLLLKSMQSRIHVSIKEHLSHSLASAKDLKKYKTDDELGAFLQKKFTKIMDKNPLNYDLTFISPFSPCHGIKIAFDKARNVPWSNFSEAFLCCNPPAAFYKDNLQPMIYDRPLFTRKLDLSSTNREPAWKDGFFHLKYRSYHKYLIIIIQLKEIEVKITPVGYKYSLCDEAWTAIQVFNQNFVYTSHYQLPLIQGCPSLDDLHDLESEPLKDWLSRCCRENKIHLVPGASVMVRLCDGQRDGELPTSSPNGIKTKLDMSYLPDETRAGYEKNGNGHQLLSMVPDGKKPEDFVDHLANMFRELVYQPLLEANDYVQ